MWRRQIKCCQAKKLLTTVGAWKQFLEDILYMGKMLKFPNLLIYHQILNFSELDHRAWMEITKFSAKFIQSSNQDRPILSSAKCVWLLFFQGSVLDSWYTLLTYTLKQIIQIIAAIVFFMHPNGIFGGRHHIFSHILSRWERIHIPSPSSTPRNLPPVLTFLLMVEFFSPKLKFNNTISFFQTKSLSLVSNYH